MSRLDTLFLVTINIQSSAITAAGFGTPAILSHKAKFTERVRLYTDASGLVTDGYVATDYEYLAAQAITAQSPRPTQFAVIRADDAKPTQVWKISAKSVVNSTAYKLYLGTSKTAFTYTSDASATNDEIAIGVEAAINAAATAAGFTSAVAGGAGTQYVTVTGNAAGNWCPISVDDISLLAIEETTTSPAGLSAALDAALLESPSTWYALTASFASAAYVATLATWVESNEKLLLAGANESAIATHVLSGATDVAAAQQTASHWRTAILYHPDPLSMIGPALAGKVAPLTVGTWTAAYKTLAGVDGYSLTPTQIANVEAKNASHYTALSAAVYAVQMGRTAVGGGKGFIDVVVNRDWLKSQIQTAIANLMTGALKVPYTDEGVAQITGVVRAVLQQAERQQIIVAGWTVTAGLVADQSASDKNNRRFPAIAFGGTLAGAIHVVDTTGNLST